MSLLRRADTLNGKQEKTDFERINFNLCFLIYISLVPLSFMCKGTLELKYLAEGLTVFNQMIISVATVQHSEGNQVKISKQKRYGIKLWKDQRASCCPFLIQLYEQYRFSQR